ncbi:YitT family protein [Aminithiophilus ramosus]|uniref:YitT family protein n=1 Tax=Aminithiophilus ramosus TaxID=3029084 RepID=A0A9Q7EVJ9_9BACT|nr:YitT family protein [Aminithiophilus ramosus]QTX32513.1 YitT family protein [Aminithiophilus ramosus]
MKQVRTALLKGTAFIHQNWISVLSMTLGSALVAAAIALFVIPARLPDSGVTGLAILLKYIWNIPASLGVWGLNALLFAYGWKVLPRRFLGWTFYAVVVFTFLLDLFSRLPAPPITDKLLLVVAAAALKGTGGAMVFNAGASLAGTDIIASALRRKKGIEIGKFTFYINAVIIAISLPVVGLENMLYGLVLLYINAWFIDNGLKSFDMRKQVIVIASDPREVKDYLMRELHRGATVLKGEGAFTGQPRDVLLAVLTPRQVVELKRHLARTDPRAFVILSDASEVVGRGFKQWKKI